MDWFRALFGQRKAVIGMAHLPALPGTPLYDEASGLDGIIESVLSDVRSLQEGGVHAVLFCNEGDRPYEFKVGPEIVAAMVRVICEVRPHLRVPFGVDVLWDPHAALAVAGAVGAAFVRGVFTGAYAADMGLWDTRVGCALRYRRMIGAHHVRCFFNITAEFAAPLAPRPLGELARSVVFSSLADAVCVSGPMTGASASLAALKEVKEALPDVPVLANTGVRADNVRDVLSLVDGVIVGTSLKRDGVTWNPVDPERVRAFMAQARAALEG